MSLAQDLVRLRHLDTETREAAQVRFDGPMVVEAGAGTGKTTVLVARIAAWCLGPGWERAAEREPDADPAEVARSVLSRVVAITFTEAAAAEMELRTARVLRELAAGKLPEGVAKTALPGDGVRESRAAALAEALAELEICTIHAFCRRILATHPLEARLHPAFQVDADGRGHEAVVREVVEQAIRAGYGAPGDPDLIALAVEGWGPAEIEEALIALESQGVSSLDLERDPLAPARLEEFFAALESTVSALTAAGVDRMTGAKGAKKAPAIVDALDRTRGRLAQRSVGDGASLVEWLAEFNLSWAEHRSFLNTNWAKGKFGKGEIAAIGDDAQALSAASRRWLVWIDHCAQIDPETLQRGRAVLAPLLARVHAELRRRGFTSFSGLLSGARSLLARHDDIRALVQGSIDQLLVDEFQDTDPDQCDIVAMLALEGPENRRPGLFLVGDPKQSIYSWRRADLRAYEGFIERAAADVGGRGRLSQNFRSLPPILEEVERIVEPVMRATPGVQPPFERLVPCDERCDAAPPASRSVVEHWISWDRDTIEGHAKKTVGHRASALEAQALARDLVELHAGEDFQWSDAAVLFRTSSDLETYLRALREAGVPYAVEREKTFYRRREVIDAAALVRCVLDPDDHLALLTTLRSSAVGVPDVALLPLWAGELPRLLTGLVQPSAGADATLAEIDACIGQAKTGLPEGVAGIERLAGWDDGLRVFARTLLALRHAFETRPVDVFIEALRNLSLFEVTEASRFLGDFRVANLDRFFREVRDELDDVRPDVQGLLRRLRKGVTEETEAEGARPAEAVDDAVRVMTIHKAKGLDFKHTYLVQGHKQAGKGRSRGARPVEAERVGEADGPFEYALFGAPTLGFHVVLEHRAVREAAERVRTLYVAMTRASDRLVLMGAWDLGPFVDESKQKAPEIAESFVALSSWRNGLPALPERAAELASEGLDSFIDDDGVRWLFPALTPEAAAEQSAPEPAAPRAPAPAPNESDAVLERLCAEALARMVLPIHRVASLDASRPDPDDAPESRSAARSIQSSWAARSIQVGPAAGREARRIAGTAVHRVLEELALDLPVPQALAAGKERLPEIVSGLSDESGRTAAVAHATEVIERLGASQGDVAQRLASLGESVVARELPVLLSPSEENGNAAFGFVVGTLDLVYRDPKSDQLVVADFKTDEVNAPHELEEKKRLYAGQGAVYQRALREALALDYTPRFELWMLWTGDVVDVA